jgi:hypothetical protein
MIHTIHMIHMNHMIYMTYMTYMIYMIYMIHMIHMMDSAMQHSHTVQHYLPLTAALKCSIRARLPVQTRIFVHLW